MDRPVNDIGPTTYEPLGPPKDMSLLDDVAPSQLAGYVQKCFADSKVLRARIDMMIIEAERAVNGEYDPAKLAAIAQLKGSQLFVKLTGSICRGARAILMDVLFQAGKRMYDIQALPVPQMDHETKRMLIDAALIRLKIGGLPKEHEDFIRNALEDHILPIMQRVAEAHVKETTAADIEEITNIIEDQLQEGGFYTALEEFLDYFTKFPAAFIKGPIFVKDRALNWVDDELGDRQLKGNEKTMPIYKAVHPKDIFPAPDSIGIDDSWLIHRESLPPGELYDLIGTPGFDEEAIRAALREYQHGFHEQAPADMVINTLEYRYNPEMTQSKKLDILEYWGAIQGQMLLDEGMSPKDIDDPEKSYDICVYVCGNHVLKAMLNPDPLGRKPFAKGSYNEIPGRFWGEGIPKIIDDIQTACNAVMRAVINNAGIASGPQVERNIDRRAADAGNSMLPWQIWDITDAQMSGAPAIRFYQPEIVVTPLIQIFEHFKAMAHEFTGVPSFNFGNATPQDTTSTASGFSMLISQTAKGMKLIVANIDNRITEPILNRHYYFGIWFKYFKAIRDSKIIAKGSSSLIAKEQQAVRRNEFMQTIQLPLFAGLIPREGLINLVKEMAQSLEIDVEKLFPPETQTSTGNIASAGSTRGALPLSSAAQGGNLPGAMSINPAGDQSSGQDFALHNQPPQLQQRYQTQGGLQV
ncbi:MAG: hypothetical protein HQK95_09025 [Nitrospirae bacterium]|nr:hypothetical protein [Nitrospirota bacterium]